MADEMLIAGTWLLEITDVVTEVVDGKTIATLTFSGDGIIGGSLDDGNYRLTMLDTITDVAGNQFDGDGDGVAGGNATDEFFRFFGDSNADGIIDVLDLLEFRIAYGDSVSGDGYNPNYDFDGDGLVDIRDLLEFRRRYLETI